MTTEKQYPDLLLPPFWGNSDLLTVTIDDKEVRIIYCYFPIITENTSITLLNPYNEMEEVTTLSFSEDEQELVERFRPEGDLLAIMATMAEEPKSLREATEFAANEIRRGLEFDAKRGDSLSLLTARSITKENLIAIEELMTFEDRLGVDLGDEHLEVSLFVHNAIKDL